MHPDREHQTSSPLSISLLDNEGGASASCKIVQSPSSADPMVRPEVTLAGGRTGRVTVAESGGVEGGNKVLLVGGIVAGGRTGRVTTAAAGGAAGGNKVPLVGRIVALVMSSVVGDRTGRKSED